MTATRFVQQVEGYYGKYVRRAVKTLVLQYLESYSGPRIDRLWRELLLNYTGQYRFIPDVAVLEEIRRKGDREQRDEVPRFVLLEGKPDEEQRRKVGELLSGLSAKMKGWNINSPEKGEEAV